MHKEYLWDRSDYFHPDVTLFACTDETGTNYPSLSCENRT